MRTSKPKIALKVIAVLAAAVLVNAALSFALEPYGSKSQVIWGDYAATEQQGATVDTALVGTSFIHNGIDPEALDAALGSSSYNLASPNQTIEESLIAVQTAYEDFGIRRAILGISITELHRSSATNPASPYVRERAQAVGWAETAATIAGQLFDHATLSSSESLNCLFPWMGNHVDPNPSTIGQNLRMRLSNMPAAEAAFVQDPSWTYVGRGFGQYGTVYDPDTALGFYFTKEFIESDDGALDPDRVRTLEKLCDYCAGNGIELIVVGVPMPANNIEYYGDRYFGQYDVISTLLAGHGVPYYDFNLAKPELFDPQPEYFADYAHLNGTGAAVFGKALGAFLADPVQRGDDSAFYTQQEYWESLEGISGLLVDAQTAEGGTLARCQALTGPRDADRVEYRMLLRDQDGNWQCMRDWNAEPDYLYERDEHGLFDIRVEARLAGPQIAAGDGCERYREFTLYY